MILSWKLLAIITKHSILDPPLILINFYSYFLSKVSLQVDRKWKRLIRRGFISTPTERAQGLLTRYQGFLKQLSVFKDRYIFHITITGNFERFPYSNFGISFLKNKAFGKNWSTDFQLKLLPWKTPHFNKKKPPFQKPLLRQIE